MSNEIGRGSGLKFRASAEGLTLTFEQALAAIRPVTCLLLME